MINDGDYIMTDRAAAEVAKFSLGQMRKALACYYLQNAIDGLHGQLTVPMRDVGGMVVSDPRQAIALALQALDA